MKRAFVGVTGASGAIYAVRLMEELLKNGVEVFASITKNGLKNAEVEFGKNYADSKSFFNDMGLGKVKFFEEDDMAAKPASGSFLMDYYIIAPASMGFIGRVATGISSNLIERSADVALKERRQLLILFREMPLSAIHLENLLKLSRLGAVIMPAAPAFYHVPKTIDDLINFTIGKILDSMGISNELYKRWS